MIAYFDTSALVALLIDEPSTATARRLWGDADRVVSAELALVEARAALAQARRMRRVDARHQQAAKVALVTLISQVDLVAIDTHLIDDAAEAAETYRLRPCDAVHLAAALRVADATTTFVAGDRALLDGARSAGLAIADLVE